MALSALALATTPAWGLRSASPRLTPAQVLKVALRVAKADADAHPSNIMLASGRLAVAVKVFDPHAHTTPYGLKALGGANSIVDLVAVHGQFTSRGPHPRNAAEPKGHVLELLMNAHTGIVFAVSLGPKVQVPLSHLGPVTRLR